MDVGHFRDEQARARFVEVYNACLPTPAAPFDVSTSLGSVRVYRYDGPPGTPVVLLPGRNASTPMWRTNLPGLLARRTVYSIDQLGEPGLSVQRGLITGAADQARWLDETLAGLDLERVHLLGVSIGGWAAVNHAVHHRGRVVSLALLDPAMTFARISLGMLAASVPMAIPGVPSALRRRVLSWIGGGGSVDGPEAVLITAGIEDFVLRLPPPTLFTDEQLRSLDLPVLALLAGRSVIHDARRAAARARRLLPAGRIEVWPDASHAINGEYPDEIAERAHRFWDKVADRA